MKKLTPYFTMLFIFISCGTYAQQEKPHHVNQVGLNFSSLNSFGLHYKTGGEKTLFRLTLLSLNLGTSSIWGRSQDSIDYKERQYGAGFRLGFERRVPIVSHLAFIWGLEAGCNFNYAYQKRESIYVYNNAESVGWSLIPMIDVVLGLTYTIADHFVIGAEIAPYLGYTYGKTNITNYTPDTRKIEETTSGFNFGVSNNFASISLAYRFGK